MSYCHSMACRTAGIQPTHPVRWRSLDGVMSVHWQAEGRAGATGYYLSPDPRFVLFADDVSDHIEMSNTRPGPPGERRPMMRAIYVPAGQPLWTRFSRAHRFAHLDLHVHADRLLRYLAPAIGASAAQAAMRRPVERPDAGAVGVLAGLLCDEMARPARHGAFAESLVGAIATGMLDLSAPKGDDHPDDPADPDRSGRRDVASCAAPAPARASGGLTPVQMARLTHRFRQSRDGRLSVAQMAAVVGLSESWFATAFKATTGTTPRLWLLDQRIAAVRDLLCDSDLPLSDIAARAGFADQSHLTRSFRQITGTTPAAWRRTQRLS